MEVERRHSDPPGRWSRSFSHRFGLDRMSLAEYLDALRFDGALPEHRSGPSLAEVLRHVAGLRTG
jgi:hypothetical protein